MADSPDRPAPGELGDRTMVALAAWTAAAVLVVELTALRLLAPYLGLTLETNTIVIGMVLSAIALGSWLGGRVADAKPPRRLLGPAIGVSGAVVAITPVLVRTAANDPANGLLLPVTALCLVVPGALLSAVVPMLTKLRLATLDETGRVVGRLSAAATAGSIVGTVVTGFVLVTRFPVTGILVGLGALLLITALLVDIRVRGWGRFGRSAAAAVVAGGALSAWALPDSCDAETTYHCAEVVADDERESGRVLVLDGLRHSYVDLEDPTHLEFAYVAGLAAVVDSQLPDGPVEAHHLGGGGLTLPRWLEATRPGSASTVSEIDGGVVELDRERLGLETGPDLEVRVEDARLGMAEVATDSRDLVVGDAFGGVSIPWHLTTVEAMAEVRRILRPEGVYAANLIDHGDLAFARAEVATLEEVWEEVVVLGEPVDVDAGPDGRSGGNLVAVASDRTIDTEALAEELAAAGDGWTVLAGPSLAEWVDDAPVLTDDRAPVDQLLTPYRQR
ncbi:fused MFS/spermidine synthase [Nocardioides panacisoli]|uniref:fused MFS/spermidine synthase n=1 Tax=Nocardioides panacisoli TaxID=627624 RepID=UPI001C63991A|nr:fused MFS/spermidine synthase [Nocardioides panacisoli]QYJ03451.1 fused MFS/spermidine synthase [Nocardioides panacisoli]